MLQLLPDMILNAARHAAGRMVSGLGLALYQCETSDTHKVRRLPRTLHTAAVRGLFAGQMGLHQVTSCGSAFLHVSPIWRAGAAQRVW